MLKPLFPKTLMKVSIAGSFFPESLQDVVLDEIKSLNTVGALEALQRLKDLQNLLVTLYPIALPKEIQEAIFQMRFKKTLPNVST